MKRRLGKTDIEVGAVGFGGWPIGGPFRFGGKEDGWGEVDDDASIRAIRTALEEGMNFYDTSDAYGAGRSERVLGEALKGVRHEAVISTKFGFLHDAEAREVYADYDASPRYIREACEASLRRLQTDYIDLYLFHVGGAVPFDTLRSAAETLDELKAEGKIRAYGWSTDHAETAERFAASTACSALMFGLNVLHDDKAMIGVCERHDAGLIATSPLAMGLLSGKYGAGTRFDAGDVRGSGHDWVRVFRDGRPSPEALRQLEAVRDILTSGGRTLVQGALAWIWGRSGLAVPVPGIKTAAQAKELAGAMAFGPLTAAQMAEIGRLLGRD